MDQLTARDDLGHLIKKHDQEAFHELYRTSFNKLQQYAMRYLYDWDDAEDGEDDEVRSDVRQRVPDRVLALHG